MSVLWLLLTCLALGALTARFAQPPALLHQSLNWWVLNIALPALVLDLIPTLHFDPDLWFLIVSMWGVFAGAWAVFAVLGRALNWSRGRIGALTLTCGLGNTAFVGLPMIEALRGKEGVALAVVADQLGCFIALAVGGITVAAIYSGRHIDFRTIARRIVFFPTFPCLPLGVLVGAMGGWSAPAHAVLDRLGTTLVPLALFSVGLQLRLRLGRSQAGALALGLGWKLAFAPLIVFCIGQALRVQAQVHTIAVLQAAMAPMISAAILADQYDLEADLANAVLGAGVLLSLLTVPAINQWL